MRTSVQSVAVTATCKVLGGVHLVAQTVSDMALNAEIKLRTTDTLPASQVVAYRVERTMLLQAKLGLRNPFNGLDELTSEV